MVHKTLKYDRYNVTCRLYIPLKYRYFSALSLSTLINFSHLDTSLKKIRRRNRARVFATIHEQPIPVPHYCGMERLSLEIWHWMRHICPR